jgi:hypothetical protein
MPDGLRSKIPFYVFHLREFEKKLSNIFAKRRQGKAPYLHLCNERMVGSFKDGTLKADFLPQAIMQIGFR